jgi:hypothetical protein
MTARQEAEATLAELRRIGGRLRLVGEKVMVDWPGARVPALAARLRAAKTEVRAILIVQNGTKAPESDDLDDDIRERLQKIDAILEQRDQWGRVAYSQSQVEACIIGLRRSAGAHPTIDAMLHRLNEAKKTALNWRELATRWEAKT